jgi:hypothetical protein
MGRRSRKRSAGDAAPTPDAAPRRAAAPPPPPPPQRAPRRHARIEDAPKAPWHPFPLVELSIFVGLVMVGFGFAGDPAESRSRTLLVGGIALITIASLELAIREHFAGYRSHTSLLAASFAIAVGLGLWFTPLPQEALLVVAIVVGIAAWRVLRVAFEKRAGGMSWRA